MSPLVDNIYVAPGNIGTASELNTTNVNINSNDIDQLVAFASSKKLDLTIVGPEIPLVNGITDRFKEAGLLCFGPTQKAARLEGSKLFAKSFMERHGIPLARFRAFSNVHEAYDFIDSKKPPLVIKADGLAAGKGVVIARNTKEAKFAAHQILVKKTFGAAGNRILVEEFLEGEEASFICMVDGKRIIAMAAAQDHKAAYDGDEGPNTGGMGAYSPASVLNDAMQMQVVDTIIQPTIDGLREEGIEYKGFLYAGLMIGTDGQIRVLEFNCRLGDPETQPLLMRLKTSLVEMCLEGAGEGFSSTETQWDPRASLGVVATAGGYPGEFKKGTVIQGVDSITDSNVKIFHAGTMIDPKGQLVVNGGRVLCVTALGDGIADAQAIAYRSLQKISFEDMHYRTDIGHRAV